MMGKITGKLCESAVRIKVKAQKVVQDETGQLDALVWVIGSGVVMVLIVALFMVLAPDTAESIWNSFVDYATDTFGF